jgi:hypothetical protein
MKIFFCGFLGFFLASCAAPSVSEYKAPDGTSVKTVKCTSDAAKCFNVAAQSCPEPGTYRVVSSHSNAGGLIADILPGPVTWYSMTYACGASDGKMPDFKFVGQQFTPPAPTNSSITVRQQPTTTNCTRIGNSVTCNSY